MNNELRIIISGGGTGGRPYAGRAAVDVPTW